MSKSQREAFQFGGSCPAIPNIDDVVIDVAELPDFCKFDRTISYISIDPIPPPEPDPPLEYTCPCPESASPFVTFSKSADCCSWTLHLNYQAISAAACSPSFSACYCNECPEGDPYCCGSYTIWRNGKEITRWKCEDIPKGGVKSESYKDSGGCAHSKLIIRPWSGGSVSCQAYVFAEDCSLVGSVKDGVAGSCPQITICVYCGGETADEDTIKKDGECVDIPISFSIAGANPGTIDLAKLCPGCTATQAGSGCGERIKIGETGPIYIREGMVRNVSIRQAEKGVIEFYVTRCVKGQERRSFAGRWNFIPQTCNCGEDEGGDGGSDGGGS